MAARPSRTTRSSTATAASGPAPRVTRTAAAVNSNSEPPSTSLPVRRTTRSSRAATPAGDSTTASRPASRASVAPPQAVRPLWTSSRNNVRTPPPPVAAKPTVAQDNRGSTLAVPKARSGPGGLLRKMTSRDSIRPTPPTPARGSSIPVPSTPAAYRESIIAAYDGPREPLKAYLRIRPPPSGASAESYMQIIGDNQVLMVPPSDHRLNPSSSSSSLFSNALLRSSNLHLNPLSHPAGAPDDLLALPQTPDPSTYGTYYKFTSVFPSSSSSSPTSPEFPSLDDADPGKNPQGDFFRSTTLPLVRDFLEHGENCLLFAYGPSGSGKTYTVQGGTGDDAGLLPRVMDVVWRSLKGKEPKDDVGSDPATRRLFHDGPGTSTPNGAAPNGRKPAARGLGVKESLPLNDLPDVVNVDENYEFSIWVSYSEIYNEKIYDLLESPIPAPPPSTSSINSANAGGGGMFSGFSQGAKNLFKFPTVKRSALSLKADKTTPPTMGGTTTGQTFKVVSGMKEIRVHSAQEAAAVLARGQSNRRVFSTLANRVSSRSHSIFTIKVHRTPRDPRSGLPERTSKFSIVDLAGSERVVNTQTTGDRLKEAGNINKSLMVLGQCMEVLRKNQERERGRKPAIVPFRHSKLTEMFQSFFVGDGKAVMIVNVNPYETGYDENTHVMKFSAVAKGVMTVKKDPAASLAVPAAAATPSQVQLETAPDGVTRKESRVVRVSLAEGAEEEEVIYEEEDVEEDDDDAEEDEFVNALLDELSTLRTALYESQMATLLAESTARARTVREYEVKMLEMERKYQERLREEAIESELKLNAKLDILTRLHAAKTPRRAAAPSLSPASDTAYDDSDEDEDEDGEDTERDETRSNGQDDESEEEDEEEEDEEEGESGEAVEEMLLAASRDNGRDSMSPLANRVKRLDVDAVHPRPGSSTPTATDCDAATEESSAGDGGAYATDREDEDDELEASETINTVSDASAEDDTLGSVRDMLANDQSSLADRTADETYSAHPDDDDEEDASQSFDRDVSVDADDDFEPDGSAPRSQFSTPSHREKENLVPTKTDDGPSRDADGYGYDEDKSLIIEPGSKSGKKKRNLGAKRTFDADAIDLAAETPVTPMRKK